MPFRLPVLLVTVAAVVLGACGGDSGAADQAGGSSTAGTPADGFPDDVCTLLAATTAAEVLGSTEAPMTATGSPADGAAACAYGSITDPAGGLTVQVAQAAGGDPFMALVPDGTRQQPLPRPTGAVRHAIGLVPGGSGIGSTVLFDHDGLHVAVSVAGVDADDVDVIGLDRAAAAVFVQLDRP
ncbi:MAG: hypothetical protein S0880_02965 [Actinomycetota bacterium]|nr:hypothetical protein [Actinomycetota bacterium]